jgi:hypothetical protein
MTRFLVGKWIGFPRRKYYSRRLATHNACFARTGPGVEVEVGSRWVGRRTGARWREGARNEGSSRGELQDSSLSNRRMPGAGETGERVKPGDAGWDSRALKALKGSEMFEIPNSSFFLFFSALCTHQVPVVSLYELGELACRWGPESKSPPSLLFSI